MSREVGRAGVGHRTRNTLDARHRLAAFARFRVALREIGEETAMGRIDGTAVEPSLPRILSRHRRRPKHRRRRRRHGRDRERLKWAIFIATAIRSSSRRAAAAAMLTVMATRPISHLAGVVAALAGVLVTSVCCECSGEQAGTYNRGKTGTAHQTVPGTGLP